MDSNTPAISRTASEIAFLPAALEILETPPNPIGRAILACLVTIVLSAILWASLGHIDIVAVAPGKLIPSDRVKVIQPMATGQVRAIHVTDGQRVKRGEVLIELDSTMARADQARLSLQLQEEEAALTRERLFAQWLESGKASKGVKLQPLQVSLLHQTMAEHQSRLAAVDQAFEGKRAELAATQSLIEKGERTLPLITERAGSVATLASSHLVSKHSALEIEQERIEAEQDLAARRQTAASLGAAIEQLREERASVHFEAQRQTSQAIEQREARINALRQEVLKAQNVTGQQSLSAPVDGVVQQLNVHTIGGVVTPAEPLMIIVPEGQMLEVEARVLNRDIGFISEGQRATIKVDAFPFTRYGVLSGELTDVSNDAAADETLGLIYPTRVKLERTSMRIDTKEVALSAGMAVTVEVKTGQRRLIEYFLSPLLQSVDESARER